MANRLKEQEKNEKIIRGLTKLPENRKCINCGSLGPQYVCTSFSIFICTTCSGIHREFTHRVKSISMATFTPTEVVALQAGGNQRAREIYFREWDSTRQSLPDASNPERLRDFIKAVYVEKRYSGDRRGRLSDADDDTRKPDRFKYSQSPAYEDRDDRRYSNRPGSRGSDRGFDEKMSPARFDERDRYDSRGHQDDRDRRYNDRDRRFDDRERRYEDRDRYYEDRDRSRFDDRDRRYDDRDRRGDDRERRYEYEEQRRWDDRESRSNRRFSDDLDKRPSRPALYRGGETPPMRSVRDILGDDVPKLRVEDGGRPNGRVEDGGSPHSISSSQGEPTGRLRSFKSIDVPVNGTAKVVSPQPALTDSLIDFSVDPEPPKPAVQTATATIAFDPFGTTVNEPGKANTSFDPFATDDTKTPFVASTASTASTAFDPFSTAEASSTSGWASFDLSPPKPAQNPAESFLQQPAQGKVNDTNPPQQNSGLNGWPPQMQASQNMQDPWNRSAPASIPPQQLHQVQSVQSQQQPPAPVDNGQQLPQRREIPEGLFAVPNFSGMHMMRPGFPFQHHPGYGAPMPMPGPVPAYMHPPRAKSNPFDLAGEPTPSPFPSMAPLQSALPSFNAGPLSSPAPALGGPPQQWSQPGMGGQTVIPPASYPPSGMPGGGFNQQQIPPHMIPHFAPSAPNPVPAFGNPGPFTNGPLPFTGLQPSGMQPGGGGGGGNPFG